jgi:hypothetical protein
MDEMLRVHPSTSPANVWALSTNNPETRRVESDILAEITAALTHLSDALPHPARRYGFTRIAIPAASSAYSRTRRPGPQSSPSNEGTPSPHQIPHNACNPVDFSDNEVL